jgi:hypothetical protein
MKMSLLPEGVAAVARFFWVPSKLKQQVLM